MILKDISLETPEDNLLFDEALFVLAEKFSAEEYMRFWESSKVFVVLGRIGQLESEVNIPEVKRDGVPVLRRTSGGGTVVQGVGCLNYSLVLNKKRDPAISDLRKSYGWISEKVICSLKKQGIDAVFRPISDIAIQNGEKKFSGNAQRRGKNFVLHHGTILYDFNLELVSRYLLMPKDIPEYRRSRHHNDFVTNISINPQLFKSELARTFSCQGTNTALTIQEHELLVSLRAKSAVEVRVYPPQI